MRLPIYTIFGVIFDSTHPPPSPLPPLPLKSYLLKFLTVLFGPSHALSVWGRMGGKKKKKKRAWNPFFCYQKRGLNRSEAHTHTKKKIDSNLHSHDHTHTHRESRSELLLLDKANSQRRHTKKKKTFKVRKRRSEGGKKEREREACLDPCDRVCCKVWGLVER